MPFRQVLPRTSYFWIKTSWKLHNFESNSVHDARIITDILQVSKDKYLYLNEYSE